jgi:hypothetical protein
MKKFISTIIVLCAMTFVSYSQNSISLSMNPEKRKTYTYLYKTEMAQKTTVGGMEIDMNMSTDMRMDMIIKDKTNSEINTENIYRGIAMSVSNSMFSLEFDSKKPIEELSEEEKIMARLMNGMIGKSINVIFAPNGSVKSVSGFEQIYQSLVNNIEPTERDMLRTSLQSFNDEAMKQTFEQTFCFYPQKSVKVGDTWQNNVSFNIAGMNTSADNTFTLKSVTSDAALIEVVSVLVLAGVDNDMTGEMSGSQKGEIMVNIKTGMLEKSEFIQALAGNITMQGMTVAMNLTTKASTFLQK